MIGWLFLRTLTPGFLLGANFVTEFNLIGSAKWKISSSLFKVVLKGGAARAQAFQVLWTDTPSIWQSPPLRP